MIMYDKNNKKENTPLDEEEKSKNYMQIIETIKDFFLRYKFIILIVLVIFIIFFSLYKYNKSLNTGPVSSSKGLSISLIGDKTITIAKGSNFLDPGYKATDKDEGDLTDKVQILGILDTDKVGTYTRYYTVENSDGTIVEITRTIIVKDMPITRNLTLTLNGSSTINLKLGENYVEPGYVASDNVEGNLTDKVLVESNLDLSKEGTYKITYKVTNSVGDTKEVYRTVNITKPATNPTPQVPTKKPVNFSVNITTSTTAFTNTSVIIRLVASGTGYSHTILPTGQVSYSNIVNYSAAKNDTYVFTVYDVNGEAKTYTKTINNIDKVLPTGTCKGQIIDNKTVVNVTASDDNGINYHVYQSGNTKSSNTTSTTYTFYFQTRSANVSIYDRAGNVKTIMCVIDGKVTTSVDPLKVGSKPNPTTTIPCKTSRTEFNNELKARVNKAGPRTRNGAVAAAIYLSSVIGYKIPYFYAGGHYHYSWDQGDNFLGVSPQWGCSTKMTAGGSDVQHNGSYYPAGFDCSGFVAWILVNSGWKISEVGSFSATYVKTTWNGVKVSTTPFKGSKGKIKPGDVVWRSGHVGFVIAVNGDIATIANAKNYASGLVVEDFSLTTGKKVGANDVFTTVMLMDNFYNKG